MWAVFNPENIPALRILVLKRIHMEQGVVAYTNPRLSSAQRLSFVDLESESDQIIVHGTMARRRSCQVPYASDVLVRSGNQHGTSYLTVLW